MLRFALPFQGLAEWPAESPEEGLAPSHIAAIDAADTPSRRVRRALVERIAQQLARPPLALVEGVEARRTSACECVAVRRARSRVSCSTPPSVCRSRNCTLVQMFMAFRIRRRV